MKRFLLVVATLLAVPAQLSAATYVFSHKNAGGTVIGSGQISTSDTLNAVGGFNILSASGIFDSVAITGIFANPVQPNVAVTSGFASNFTYNNVLFPAAARPLDRFGLAFNLANNVKVNVFDGIADGTVSDLANPFGVIRSSGGGVESGVFSISAVPEASTWAMMIVGFGAIGGAMRSGKRRTARALA